jgi:hypothetical protein
MTTPPLTDQQRADIITRHHHTTDPEACGTCRDLTVAGKSVLHPECHRRATLAPAWDAPDYEDLVDLNEEERAALPARFHTPVYIESATPKSWNCAVCWGDGWVTRWPCETATAQGHRVFVPEHYAGQAQQDLGALLTDRDRLAAELDAARAERDAFADRVDTLTAVAKGNKRHVQEMYTDLLKAQADAEQARAENDRLRQQLAEARAAALTEGAELIETHARATGLLDLLGAVDLLLAARTQPAT